MEHCFKCKVSYPPYELKSFKSGRSFCSTCILKSFYSCEYCKEEFILGDFAADYNEETAYYETSSGNKDIMDLEKLVGALECLKFHTKSQIIMRQNKITKDFGEKLRVEEETIPNLFYLNGK
nr:5787_t:CDS:2 [Entrophospora candida]